MSDQRGGWSEFLQRTVAAVTLGSVGVFAAIRAAHAWEGTAHVEARSHLTVAGRLTGVPTTPAPVLQFTFHKAAVTLPCIAPSVTLDAAHYDGTNFSADIDYDACGRGFFDGSNVNVDVSVGSTMVVSGAAINPVPYAQFAAVAGTANTATVADRANGVAFSNLHGHDAATMAFAGACLVPAPGAHGGYFVVEVPPTISCATGCTNARRTVGNPGAAVTCVPDVGLTFTSNFSGTASVDGQHYYFGDECTAVGSPAGFTVVSRLCCCMEPDVVLPWGGGP